MSFQCPPGSTVYTIRPGDTLYRIARQFNTTVDAIIQANPGIIPESLQVARRICIPGTIPSVCPPGSTPYTIIAGDTLYSLARQFNTAVDALNRANPSISPNNLQVGQSICIPRPSGACPPGSEVYTIQPGDTFYQLARRFNTGISTLVELNPGINPNNLSVGQQICIPRPVRIYANRDYQVSFLYPANWQRVNDERYEGPDGFFLVNAIASTGSIQEVCRNEAFHVLRPYGSSPITERLTIQGQEACLIIPSSDQPPDMHGQAALIVRYPAPVTINNQTDNFFVLYADKNHIRQLARTLEFFPV
jgi:LysM repeat protein